MCKGNSPYQMQSALCVISIVLHLQFGCTLTQPLMAAVVINCRWGGGERGGFGAGGEGERRIAFCMMNNHNATPPHPHPFSHILSVACVLFCVCLSPNRI